MDNHNAPYVAESDTSRARAQREDTNGTTWRRRDEILNHLRDIGINGAIWSDLAELTGSHHGQEPIVFHVKSPPVCRDRTICPIISCKDAKWT